MSRTLVVAPNWIGDALLAQPLFARLREARPGERIDALAPPWTAPVLGRMPEIDEVIQVPFNHGELKIGARWRLGRRLKERDFGRAVVLPNSWKSALIPFFAGIPERIGYVGEARYGLLNVVHKLDEKALPLMAERYAKLAEEPGEPPQRPLPRVRLRVDEANLIINIGRLGLNRARPVIAMCPGAEFGPAKRWPTRHFAALALHLQRRGNAIWLFGSQKDRPVAEEIIAQSGDACVNLCGRTNLAAAIDLMSVASCVVTNDSGLMHVAAAVGRPIVALYGSSSPLHTPPLSKNARIVTLNVECSPCYQRVCPLGHFKCMNDLLPERVAAEIDKLETTAA